MKIVIGNHFELQGKHVNTDIRYYLSKQKNQFSSADYSKYIDIKLIDENVIDEFGRPLTVGMIHLMDDIPRPEQNNVSLSFISIHPDYKGKGYSKKLIKEMIDLFKKKGYNKLYRTEPGIHCPKEFTEYMTSELNKNNIEWFY